MIAAPPLSAALSAPTHTLAWYRASLCVYHALFVVAAIDADFETLLICITVMDRLYQERRKHYGPPAPIKRP